MPKPCSTTTSSSPSASSARSAGAWSAIPTRDITHSGWLSTTCTSTPRRPSAPASARPPMPPPTISTRSTGATISDNLQNEPGGLEVDDAQVRAALAQRLGDDAAVAAGGIGLEAQQRGRRRRVELGGELVDRLGRLGLHVRAVRGVGLGEPAGMEEPPHVRRRAELAAVLVG